MYLSLENEVIEKVKLFDLQGKQVESFMNNSTEAKVNLYDLASGVYLVQIEAGGQRKIVRIIKE